MWKQQIVMIIVVSFLQSEWEVKTSSCNLIHASELMLFPQIQLSLVLWKKYPDE